MKTISADPPTATTATTADEVEEQPQQDISSAEEEPDEDANPSLSSEEGGSLLELGQLSLDRSDDAGSPEVELDPLPGESVSSADAVTARAPDESRRSGRTKRPSFREMFRLPLRRRSRSSSESKSKPTGCAGWLDKKRRKSQSSSREETPPPLISPSELDESESSGALRCARCYTHAGAASGGDIGVTYTKNSSGLIVGDGQWLCPQCARGSSQESDLSNFSDRSNRVVPRLSHLVMDVLKLHVRQLRNCHREIIVPLSRVRT